MNKRMVCALVAPLWVIAGLAGSSQSQLSYEVRQLTSGPAHHFYGYIGHVGNSPYSADGKYLVALRSTFQDRMPGAQDAADIVLLDAQNKYAETKIEETRGWNPQQGAMIYWNPEQPSRQFFFAHAQYRRASSAQRGQFLPASAALVHVPLCLVALFGAQFTEKVILQIER